MGLQNVPFTCFQTRGLEQKNRSLRYDMNAMSDFEQMTGMGLATLMSTRAVFAATRALLWAGLKHQDRGLTVDRVGSLMQDYVYDKGGSIDELLEACITAAIAQKAIPDTRIVGDVNDEPDGGTEKNANPSPTTGTTTAPGPVTSEP